MTHRMRTKPDAERMQFANFRPGHQISALPLQPLVIDQPSGKENVGNKSEVSQYWIGGHVKISKSIVKRDDDAVRSVLPR